MSDLPAETFTFTDLPPYVEVGKYTSIARDVEFMEPGQNHICVENRDCVYTTHWGHAKDKAEKTIIGNDVWIGIGAKILHGVKIGDGAIVGAYSVVAKDVESFSVVVGNPAKITRYRFTPLQIIRLKEMKWWDREITDTMKGDMLDIKVFLDKYDK